MKNRVIHLAEQSVFLDGIIKSFESLENIKNDYLIYTGFIQHTNKFQYKDLPNVHLIDCTDEIESFIMAIKDEIRLVIFHMILADYKKALANTLSGIVPLHGIIWGWEIYENNFLLDPLLPKTKKALKKVKKSKRPLSFKIKHFIKYKVLKFENLPVRNARNAQLAHINKFDTISTLLESEYLMLKKKYAIEPQYIPFGYKPDFLFVGHSDKRLNILVGNNSASSNNHLDCLPFLRHLKLGSGKRIILPLNYGRTELNVPIKEQFTKIFNQNVTYLDTFLGADEYDDILNSCGFVVLNSIRQQALGNVFAVLYKGAKLFLNSHGLLYQELIKKGFKVYRIEEIKNEYPNPLPSYDIKKHQALVLKYRGDETLQKLNLSLVSKTYK